jgi:energy-converting hydrogenase Eha subunit A
MVLCRWRVAVSLSNALLVKDEEAVARVVVPLFLLLLMLAALVPGIAEACAVCAPTDEEEVRMAFIVSTAFMTFFPLIVLGSVVWWIRSRYKAMEP